MLPGSHTMALNFKDIKTLEPPNKYSNFTSKPKEVNENMIWGLTRGHSVQRVLIICSEMSHRI